MTLFSPTADQITRFHSDGFFLVDGLFDAEEVELLKSIARADHEMQRAAASRGDGEGGAIRPVVRNELYDDIDAPWVPSQRLVTTTQPLLAPPLHPTPPQMS